ncbi:hypothetical protein G6F35_008868 [Rhizopus arrhizus]|nr:hypothetical protein G6F35_008868 [Rhizopus arrhizus]
MSLHAPRISLDPVVSDDLQRTHTDHALQLVEEVTGTDQRRRPSKAGVLSNLLKLDVFDSSDRRPVRPTPLRSLTSSQTLLQRMAPSVQDIEKADHRMAIASEIADILSRQDFILHLGKALVRTGALSHRIEAAMSKVGQRLGIDGSYAVLPGLIIVTWGDLETHTSETHLIRCSRGWDIGRLEKTDAIVGRMVRDEMGLEEGNGLLEEVIKGPATWSAPWILLAYVLSSAFTAPLFFNGSWTDCWVSALFGLVVGALTYLSEQVPMLGSVFEMVITIPIAVIALALHPHICFAAVAMGAIIIALPGFSLTCSVMELSAKNFVNGSIHLIYALMYILFLAFGIGYGCSIWRLTHPDLDIDVSGSSCQSSPDPSWSFLFLPLSTIGFAMVFGASVSQWPVMILNSALGYTVSFFVSKFTGPASVITPSVGAFAIGLFGNLYGRITKRLAFVPIVGGTVVLVPGSIGVRGAIKMFDGSNDQSGSAFVFQVLGIALSITLGLFLSNLVVYPKGKKRSVFLGF